MLNDATPNGNPDSDPVSDPVSNPVCNPVCKPDSKPTTKRRKKIRKRKAPAPAPSAEIQSQPAPGAGLESTGHSPSLAPQRRAKFDELERTALELADPLQSVLRASASDLLRLGHQLTQIVNAQLQQLAQRQAPESSADQPATSSTARSHGSQNGWPHACQNDSQNGWQKNIAPALEASLKIYRQADRFVNVEQRRLEALEAHRTPADDRPAS